MAYNKAFNPDALPAHAQPDEAAAALGNLSLQNRKPSPQTQLNRPSSQSPFNNNQGRATSPGGRRTSPAGLAAQRAYAPTNLQTNQPYNDPNSYGQYQNQNQNQHRLNSPPPPANYGYGPRPTVQAAEQRRSSHPSSNLPSQQYAPSRTPAPPDADSQEFVTVFQSANTSRTGAMTTAELGSALVNSDVTPFDNRTIQSLMRMFSTSPPGQPQGPTITFQEFQNLWRFLAAWRELFEKFDEDGSGRISLNEFSKALLAFGYRLTQPFVSLLYQTFRGSGGGHERRGSLQSQGMSFDLFVQACISLKRMTDVFKGYDDDRDGYITVSFEEFLTEILKLKD
jgi:peflin